MNNNSLLFWDMESIEKLQNLRSQMPHAIKYLLTTNHKKPKSNEPFINLYKLHNEPFFKETRRILFEKCIVSATSLNILSNVIEDKILNFILTLSGSPASTYLILTNYTNFFITDMFSKHKHTLMHIISSSIDPTAPPTSLYITPPETPLQTSQQTPLQTSQQTPLQTPQQTPMQPSTHISPPSLLRGYASGSGGEGESEVSKFIKRCYDVDVENGLLASLDNNSCILNDDLSSNFGIIEEEKFNGYLIDEYERNVMIENIYI